MDWRVGYLDAVNQAEMKQGIMERGALYTTMWWDPNGLSYNQQDGTTYYCPSPYEYGGSHAVTIAGWADDHITAAPTPGAWLVKNSWGTGWGDSGYFWLSYADAIGGKWGEAFCDTASPEAFSTVYYHDYYGNVDSSEYTTAFNAFTASSYGPLKSIGFFTLADGMSYDVRVYDTFDGTTLGTLLASKTGTAEEPGWHTVDLDELVPMTPDDVFYLYLGFTNVAEGMEPLAIDRAKPNYSPASVASAGESFYFDPETDTWEDLTDEISSGNFCIKALTAPLGKIEGSIWIDNNGDDVRQETEYGLSGWTVYLDSNNNGQLDTWSNEFAGVDLPLTIPSVCGDAAELTLADIPGRVLDVRVTLSATQPNSANLFACLVCPSGQQWALTLFSCGSLSGANLVDTAFDDAAPAGIGEGTAPYTGVFRPETPLGGLRGIDPNGTWRLELFNDDAEEETVLTDWSLELTTGTEPMTRSDGYGRFSFSNLLPGDYDVRVVPQSGWTATRAAGPVRQVEANYGQTTTGAGIGNFPLTIDCPGPWYVQADASGERTEVFLYQETNEGAPGYSINRDLLPSLTIRAANMGYSTLTLDMGNGNPIPDGGMTFLVDEGESNRLRFKGSPEDDAVTITPGLLTVGSSNLYYPTVAEVAVDLGGDWDSLTANVPLIILEAPQTLALLDIRAGARVVVARGGGNSLVTRSLVIAEDEDSKPLGTLDLMDNNLIVDYAVSDPSPLNTITRWVRAGYNKDAGYWNGMGITSTEAITGDLNADSIPDLLTALGVLDNINDNPGGLAALEGIAVDRTSVLVKYTYWGDANFDGTVTYDDYDVTDYYFWFPPPPLECGWWTGDYDYDGGIDFDDYDLQDYAFWFQENPL